MDAPVHESIVVAAVDLLPPELHQELDTPIPPVELEDYRRQLLQRVGDKEYKDYADRLEPDDPNKKLTYLDVVRLGARIEDSTAARSVLPDPDTQNVPSGLLPGDYAPWLEHYWDPSLDPDKGLTITSGFALEVVSGLAPIVGESAGELFNDVTGFFTGDATIVLGQFRSCLKRAQDYWQTWVLEPYRAGDKIEAYLNLGRVCHLLADAGTPSHVQNDPHLGISLFEKLADKIAGQVTGDTGSFVDTIKPVSDFFRIQDDDYEDLIKVLVINHGRVLPADLLPPASAPVIFNPEWDLARHFTELAEITRLYDSDDADGKGSGHPYHWDHWDDSLSGLLPIDRDITGDLTDHAVKAIARDMIPNSVQFTAGLLCMFYREIGLRFQLNTLEVRLEKFTVLDDTDPFGSGEIFLKAWIDGCRKQQFGQYDMGSGDTKHFKDVAFWVVIRDLDAPTNMNLSCYDDDGNYFWDDTESLGHITMPLTPRQIPKEGQLFEVKSHGGSGSFLASMFVRLIPCGESDEEVLDLPGKYESLKKFNESPADLHNTRYTLRRNPPVYLNLKSMKYHHTADRKHPRPCGKWAALPPEQRLEFSTTLQELVEKKNGSSFLMDVMLKKFGPSSPEYERACRVTTLESECACTRDGR